MMDSPVVSSNVMCHRKTILKLVKSCAFLLFLFLVLPAQGTDIKTLEARYQESITTPHGKEYEMKAVQAFWGDASFMRECAPPNSPIAESLTIYFEVKRDGGMGELIINPKTKVANCIAKNVKIRQFPKPPNEYVGKIDLQFTE